MEASRPYPRGQTELKSRLVGQFTNVEILEIQLAAVVLQFDLISTDERLESGLVPVVFQLGAIYDLFAV